jgi:hypothetical protein
VLPEVGGVAARISHRDASEGMHRTYEWPIPDAPDEHRRAGTAEVADLQALRVGCPGRTRPHAGTPGVTWT